MSAGKRSACSKLARTVRAFIDSTDQDRIEEFDAMFKALKAAERKLKSKSLRKS